MTTVYKRWADNERLYAADLNNLSDQAIPYFANATARDAAIASPVTGQFCYQADVSLTMVYQGGRWVSQTLFTVPMLNSTLSGFTVTTASRGYAPVTPGTNIWLEQHHVRFQVITGGTALGASHKWVGVLSKVDAALALTTVSTTNIDSGSSAAWRVTSNTVNALMGTFYEFENLWTKTGTPGNLLVLEYLTYRVTA